MKRAGALLAALAGISAVPASAATPDEGAFVVWARAHAATLPDCGDTTDARALAPFAPVIGDARVVALGEPAHGAHQPLALRNCLFRYMVEHRGFTAIAIETGLQESRALAAYVAGGAGDARQLVHDNLSWGFGRFEENVALVAWMHAYNADPAHSRKIRFYGIDMSGGDRSFEWRPARRTADAATTYLARFAPVRSRTVQASLAPLLPRFSLPGYRALTAPEQRRLRTAVAALVRVFDANRAALVSASGERAFAWARQDAVLARQLEAMFRVSGRTGRDDALRPDDYLPDTARNRAMAENVRWVLSREGACGRVLVFAHDGHVMNAAGRGGAWSIYRRPATVMGQYLRAALGDRLRIVITGAASAAAPLATGAPGSIDRALIATGIAPSLLDLRPAGGGAARWLRRDQSLRTNFTSESLFVPHEAADAIAYFAQLQPRGGTPDR